MKELTLYCSFNCVDTAEGAGQIRCKLKLEAGTPRRLLYSSEAMTVGEGAFWDIVHQAGASLDFALYEGERLLLGRSGVEIWGHITGAVDDPALLVTDRLMRPGMAQLVPRRLVRYEAAGDFKRTIDFYIGGDAEEEELPGGADERA